MLALDARGAASGTLLRDDLASPDELAGALAGKPPRPAGIALLDGTRRLEFDARATVMGKGRGDTGDAALTAAVEDRHGTTHQLRLGDLPVDGRTRTLSVDVGSGRVPGRLRLTGIDLSVYLPFGPSEKHRFTVSGLRAATGPGEKTEDITPPEDFARTSSAVTASNTAGAAQRSRTDLHATTDGGHLPRSPTPPVPYVPRTRAGTSRTGRCTSAPSGPGRSGRPRGVVNVPHIARLKPVRRSRTGGQGRSPEKR